MRYRELGNTKVKVSEIALGCEGLIGLGEEEVQNLFDFAIAQGINFLDLYAPNPDMRSHVGCALFGRREAFVLQGHVGSVWEKGQYLRTRDMEKVKDSFEDMMKRLQTDYLDIGMIHYVDTEEDFKTVFQGPMIQYVEELKAQGRIRHIGMSSHNPRTARMAVETGLLEVLLFSVNPCYDMQPAGELETLFDQKSYEGSFHNQDRERKELYELCERMGVAIDVMKAYGGGDLLSETLSPFGRAFTPIQCIHYALTRPAVAAVMTGCRSLEEIRAALTYETASEEEKDYAPLLTGLSGVTFEGHCMYCGHCAPCPVGISVADVTKYLNLALAQGFVPETVKGHYDLLSHHAGECVACGRCEKNCPFQVPIMENMKKAREVFQK